MSDVGICSPGELRLAAWNIRIMSNKSRTDAELRAIARTLADYDFIAIVDLSTIQRVENESGTT